MLPDNESTIDKERLPVVSVIIPTHNRASLLKTALDSVYAQEGIGESFEIEVIVIDDASSDNTPDVVLGYPAKFIRHDINQGASAARNSGIKVCKGKYIAFLDDDDLFLPHKLKAQVPLLESRPDIGLVYGQISISGEASCDAWPESAPSGNVFGELLVRTDDFMSPDAILVRREAFEKSGGFDESLPTMEHYDMYVRLAFHVPFLFVPGVVAHGRYSQTGKWHTNVKNRNNERVLPRIVERALAMLPNDAASEAVRRKARVAVFSTIAGQRWETEDVREVRDHLIRTLDQYPWMLSQPECVENLYRIAGQLALGSSAPIGAVRAFLQQVKAAAPAFNAMQQLQQRRLLAAIWRGAAHAAWSVRSYQAAVSAASRAVLCDPVYLTRALFFKR